MFHADEFLKSSDRVVSIVSNVNLREQHLHRTDDTDDGKGRENFINTLSPSGVSQMVGSFLSQQMRFIADDVSLMSRHVFGNTGEAWAYAEFERAGYQVARVRQGDQRGDLRVTDPETGEVWRVEVKSMRADTEGHYQACLRRQIKARVCTDAAHSEYVLLLAFPRIGAPVPYLIPVDSVRGLNKIAIPSDPRTYAGKWSIFRQNHGLKMPDISRED